MSTKEINDAAFPLRDHWDEIKRDFFAKVPGVYLEVDCVYRSPEEQFELYKKGRNKTDKGLWVVTDREAIVTNIDGYKIKGAHNYNPARAIDVCAVNNQTGKRSWKEEWYTPLIEIAERYNLVSGGKWKSLKDFPHIEIRDFKNYQGA